LLFSHFPVYPPNPHNLWNAEEVLSLIDKFSCVRAYINGHNHKGNYKERNGVHYLTVKGMVENKEPTYGIISTFNDKMLMKAFGAETDRALLLKK
jgi:hypothetical protein